MKFGYIIIHIPDVAASLSFFKCAFAFSRRFFTSQGTTAGLQQAKPCWPSHHANLEA